MLESKFQTQVIAWLKQNGFWVIKYTGKVGVPDLIGCTPDGSFFALELKVKHRLSPAQKVTMKHLRDRQNAIAFEFRYHEGWRDSLLDLFYKN